MARMIDKKSFTGATTYNILGDDPITMGGKGDDYVKDGYNKNVDVYAIVSLAARKFAQVPPYVYKIKKGKTKEAKDYIIASRNNKNPQKAGDILALRKKAIDESIVDNELSQMLQKPNLYMGQDSFFETLYGYKLLTGEGNIFKNRGDNDKGPIQELIIIPRQFIELRSDNRDWWGIDGYKLQLGNFSRNIEEDDLIMWKFPNYIFDPITKVHHRGKAPLQSMLYDMQASNENAKNKLKLNKNQGARGVLFDHTNAGVKAAALTPQQHSDLKRLIDGKINTNDVAGAIAVLQGQWGYHALGMDANQLKMIEQSNLNMQKLCAGFNVPYEFFNTETTFSNKEQASRNFVYNHIAPAAYSLRDEFNRSLLLDFKLDSWQYLIEFDITALPEVTEDLSKQVAALKDAWWFTPNQRLEKMGEDRSKDLLMDKIYMPSGLKPIDEVTGPPLDSDEEILRQNNLI